MCGAAGHGTDSKARHGTAQHGHPQCKHPCRPLIHPLAAPPLAPAASIGNEATRYRDDLMDWLGVQREGYQRLSNNSSAAVNATDAAAANATAAGEEAGGAGAAAEAATEPAAEAEAAAEAAGDAAAEPEAAAESEAGDAGAEL